jgi:Family of unknown function (DUF6962)
MTIHEPMTLATDYLLTIAAMVFAIRLWRTNRQWALAFLFTALGSFFGGTYHGFGPAVGALTSIVLWKLTVFSIGLASFFLVLGSGRSLLLVAVVKLIVYMSWMTVHSDFVWVVIDYGIALLIVGVVQLVRRGPSTPWVIGSIVVSVLGAFVQMSRLTLHEHFNHNDLYHVIQLVALWLLYRGGRLTNPSTAPPMTPPT